GFKCSWRWAHESTGTERRDIRERDGLSLHALSRAEQRPTDMGGRRAKPDLRFGACVLRRLYSGQDGRKAVTAFQRVSQHHKVLLGGYDGTQKIPVGRQGRIFKGKRACEHGTHYERQNAD